jgi:hypothetical protein
MVDPNSEANRWWHTALISIIVLVLFSPVAYSLTDAILGSLCLPKTCTKGCPNLWGLFLHTLIFAVIFRYIPVV